MLASGGRAAMRSSPRLRASPSSPRSAMATQTAAAASPGPRGVTTVRVATYNVLSSALAGPAHFPGCKPEDLAASARLPRVLAKLEAEVDRDAVICLQEVSLTWAGARIGRCSALQPAAADGSSLFAAALPARRAAVRVVHGARLHVHPALLRESQQQLHGGAPRPPRAAVVRTRCDAP